MYDLISVLRRGSSCPGQCGHAESVTEGTMPAAHDASVSVAGLYGIVFAYDTCVCMSRDQAYRTVGLLKYRER